MAETEPMLLQAPVRLALLDDHVMLLDSLASWLERNAPGFDLVLRASTWLELVHSDRFPTDLVIMDLQLREAVSVEARVRTCRAAGAKVIMLSATDSRADRERAQTAGASAYLNKSQPMSQVLSVARSVMGLDDSPVSQLDVRPRAAGAYAAKRPHLSSGERQALTLYAEGHTMVEVASIMDVSYETVKTFLRRVREKYGKAGRPTSSRADLIRRAAEDDYLV
jgi:DNA-binding NarL/FixJ family response regulator